MNSHKFRAFDNVKGEMIFSENNPENFVITKNGVAYKSNESSELNFDVMEFVERKDVYDVDVYKNDIVEQKIQSEYLDESDWEIVVGKVEKFDGVWCVGQKRYPLCDTFSVTVLGHCFDDEFKHF